MTDVDQNLLNSGFNSGTLKAILKAFYRLFYFNNHKANFIRKNFNYSLNHIYLLLDSLNTIRLDVFRRTDVSDHYKNTQNEIQIIIFTSTCFQNWLFSK
jgi:hypothetical protein